LISPAGAAGPAQQVAALHSIAPLLPARDMSLYSPRPSLPIAGLLATVMLLGACGKQAPAPAATAPAASSAAKIYVVGTDAAYAPFESQNEKAEIVGFDIDVARAAANKVGLELKFVNTPWEGIFNALIQGDRDIVASAVTITAERRQTMDFSQPYFDALQFIVVKQSSQVARFNDLKPLKVGVQTGTTGDEAITKLLGKTSPNIKRFESTPLALKELEAGGVDAVVADNGVVSNYVANNPGGQFKTVTDPGFVPEQYGLAVKKGNADLLAKLDQGLSGIKADGSYLAIYTRYFGAAAAALAASAPALAISK
jgi:polar amino acid transport system substrate-binding protein